MKAVSIAGIILCCSFLVQGQKNEYPFRLENYRRPELTFQSLILSPSSRLSTGKDDDGSRTRDDYGAQTEFSVRLKQHKYRRRWEYRGEYSAGGDLYKNGGSGSDSSYRSKNDYSETSSDYRLHSRSDLHGRYYHTYLFFTGLSGDLQFSTDSRTRHKLLSYHEDDILERETDEYVRWKNYSVSGSIDLGVGRITDVTSAAVALNMFDRIKAVTGSLPALSRNQIQNVAEQIELLKEKRFLDYREGRIAVMDSLYSLLLEHRIVESHSARVTMELLDQWDYAYRQSRKTGVECKLSPAVEYSWSSDRSLDSLKEVFVSQNGDSLQFRNRRLTDKENDSKVMLSGSCEFNKPLGRFFQFTAAARAEAGLNQESNKSIVNDTLRSEYCGKYPEAKLFADAELSWYPSTRTTFRFRMYGDYHRLSDYMERKYNHVSFDEMNQDYRRTDIHVSLNLQYYFSRNLTFNAGCNFRHTDLYHEGARATDSRKASDFSLQTSLEYQIF